MTSRHIILTCLVLAALQLIAILPLPYSFYGLLRVLMTAGGLAVVTSVDRPWIRGVMLVVMMTFNPLWHPRLHRSTWVPINLTAAVTFGLIARALVPRNDKQQKDNA